MGLNSSRQYCVDVFLKNISRDSSLIVGCKNTIRGNNNIVSGYFNNVIGDNNIVYGDSNRIHGENNIHNPYLLHPDLYEDVYKNLIREDIPREERSPQLDRPFITEPSAPPQLDRPDIPDPSIPPQERKEVKPSVLELTINDNKDEETDIESEQCTICYVNKKCILYTPCNHLASCNECSRKIMTKNSPCPICRKDIDKLVKIYW